MFRSKERTQDSHRKLRRLLSEQLENRQLMASDTMQWAPVPAHLVATPSSTFVTNGSFLSTQVSGEARSMVGPSGTGIGTPIPAGSFKLSQVSPVPAGLIKASVPGSISSGQATDDGRIAVGTLDLNNAPKDGSFGKTSVVADGYAIEVGEPIEIGEPIEVGEFDLADIMPVPPELISKTAPQTHSVGTTNIGDRIEVSKLDLNNAPKDGSFGKTTVVADSDAIEVGEPIVVGEFDLADIMPVPPELISKTAPNTSSVGTTNSGDRIEVSKLDLNNAPKDGSFGETSVVADGDAIEIGEPIEVGEFDLADIMPVPPELISKTAPQTYSVGATKIGDRIEVSTLDLNNAPKDGSFGETSVVADGYAIEIGEPIEVGEFDLADVMPVPPELISKAAPNTSSVGTANSGDRIEVGTLDLSNAPKDGSFGKTTVEVIATNETTSGAEKKSGGSTVPWSGESVQRKRSSGLLRNQWVDSALSDLLQF